MGPQRCHASSTARQQRRPNKKRCERAKPRVKVRIGEHDSERDTQEIQQDFIAAPGAKRAAAQRHHNEKSHTTEMFRTLRNKRSGVPKANSMARLAQLFLIISGAAGTEYNTRIRWLGSKARSCCQGRNHELLQGHNISEEGLAGKGSRRLMPRVEFRSASTGLYLG